MVPSALDMVLGATAFRLLVFLGDPCAISASCVLANRSWGTHASRLHRSSCGGYERRGRLATDLAWSPQEPSSNPKTNPALIYWRWWRSATGRGSIATGAARTTASVG